MNAFRLRLAMEDRAEDVGAIGPDERLTCHVCGRWMSFGVHVNQVTRHRWCRRCERALTILVDEFARTVTMRCPGCGNGESAATARLLAACRASVAAARREHLVAVA